MPCRKMVEPGVKLAVDGATISKEEAMKTEIRGRHFEVSGRLREYIEKESEKLKQFYEPILDTRNYAGARESDVQSRDCGARS